MKISGNWIEDPATQAVFAALKHAGHQALFVGGCVRNALLNTPVKDIDIATDAHPEEVMKLARTAGLKAIPTGIDHGTVTVVSGGIPHEITTFREDVETTGRHAVVAFARDITQDARRRDFTMNALYARADGEVIDPLGGLDDLKARRVRFIEDPVQRIREDYLRSLRFFRFHAWYGDPEAGMDAEALDAIARHLEGLETLSRERVGGEITRLLAAPDPAPAVAAMRATGVLNAVLPGAEDHALALLVHLEQQIELTPDAMRRLAVIGGQDVADRLRLSKAEARKLTLLRDQVGALTPAIELGYRLGHDTGLSVLLLGAALLESPFDPADIAKLMTGAKAVFPIKPADLMPDYSGPALGKRIKALEDEWLASGCTLSRDVLLGRS
ncbi:CCA tRNA nucleotidyltransferase [Roseovarius sp. 2305UL8-3]|uniref:CCA tRNA nucleotidyltransferase n=1 Tax=Roseovarius conchicola TaxID=3121636 RepID=UPI0035295EAF